MSKSTSTLPAPLARAEKRFEKWRKNRTKPRIPDQLWDLAAKLARKYGVNRTATPLHLDYYDLKRRAEALPAGGKQSKTAASFIEVIPSPGNPSSACLVEIEDPRGPKMRIHLKAAGARELEAIGHLFWRKEA